MEDMLKAAGAEEVITIQRYAHPVGGARMGADETTGVVDSDLKTFAVPTCSSPTAAPCRRRALRTRR
jgi:choline dehydrogenase-like flavoprotein